MMICPTSSSGLHWDTNLLGCSAGMYNEAAKTSRIIRATRRCCGTEQWFSKWIISGYLRNRFQRKWFHCGVKYRLRGAKLKWMTMLRLDILGRVESVFGDDGDDVAEGYFRCQRVAVANDRHICTVPDINCISPDTTPTQKRRRQRHKSKQKGNTSDDNHQPYHS